MNKIDMIEAALAIGMTDQEIHELLGVTYKIVHQCRKKRQAKVERYRRDQARCRKCKYSWQYTPNTVVLCDYLEKTGRRRGCPPGAGCKEFRGK